LQSLKSRPASTVTTSKTPSLSPNGMSMTKNSSESVVKPFRHQAKSLKHDSCTNIVFDCSDAGTGKTAVRIWAFAARRKKRGGCLLVLAPKSLLRTVWAADLKKFAPHLKIAVSTAGKHEMVFAEDADVYVTNADAVKWLSQQKKSFFDKFSDLVIDESTVYKHHTSQRSKAAARVAKHFKHRCCMTATPNSNTICDVWHQVLLLDDGKRLGPSFYAFRNSVSIPTQVGRDKNALQWTDKDGAEEAVFGLLSDIVIRHRFEDCVDIPSNHQYTMPYFLTPGHLKAYLEMQETQMLQIYGPVEKRVAARMKGVRLQPLSTVSAVHAGAMAQKLLQIASGAVYESPDKYHVIDHGRYEMILDLVQERKHSLTFFLWKHQRDLLLSEADRRGITYAVIDGSVGEQERADIVARYQRGAYQTLFGHPKTMAHGFTLTKGTATIWSSPTYDLEIFTQGSKRQHRIGQTQKTETIIVTAEDTIEKKVHDHMLAKNARMTNLLDLFSTL
jgi:SNF2 family DNA or RNA helicase